MSNVTMFQGPGANGQVICRSGNKYTVGASGSVSVAPGNDVADMQAAGYLFNNPSPQDVAVATVGSMVLTAAQFVPTTGSGDATVELSGTQTGAFNVTTPTAAQILAAMPNSQVGQTFRVRVINQSSGAFTGTVVAGSGVTLTGTATIAQNTWRDFIVTVLSPTTVGMHSIATGSYS